MQRLTSHTSISSARHDDSAISPHYLTKYTFISSSFSTSYSLKESQTNFLTTSLHIATLLSFPSTPHRRPSTSPRPIRPPWFNDEYYSLHQRVTHAQVHEPQLFRIAHRSFYRTLHHKK
ncbi:hypothetical protein O6H91_10G083100 [Diphasiastrum complanatum]|uniref:Uncharacterized protein n=1 Tax=Diphasiastrum complanatum TaxID=34168 RepID=A0ACC2CJ08_DIPCM|nr:hypothetical protein O6H91_10G083100 [Diphasiastrum complanatum]